MKKLLSLALALMMVLALAACKGESDPAPADSGTTATGTSQQTPPDEDVGDSSKALVANVGDTVKCGSFEGMELEWRTLAIDAEAQKALLITSDIAAYWAFNDESAEVTWETCTLRSWLNDEFYNAAFTDEQKALILNSTLETPANPESGVGESTTTDKVFLLSYSEAQQYFTDDTDRVATVNFSEEYTKNLSGLIAAHSAFGYTEDSIMNELAYYVGTTDKWALRTSGDTLQLAAGVSHDGSMYAHGNQVDKVLIGVRPAIWVDISTYN